MGKWILKMVNNSQRQQFVKDAIARRGMSKGSMKRRRSGKVEKVWSAAPATP
jgi:hypothetical protein